MVMPELIKTQTDEEILASDEFKAFAEKKQKEWDEAVAKNRSCWKQST